LSFPGEFMLVIHILHTTVPILAQRSAGQLSSGPGHVGPADLARHPVRAQALAGRTGRAHCPRPASTPAARSGRYLGLARAPARPFARHDLAAQEQLTAPDAPWLTPLDRAGKAGDPCRAAPAQRLGALHVLR